MGSKKRRVKSKPVRRRQRSITRTSGSKSESFHYDHLEPRQLLATFYVSNSGSDSNVGTAVDAPFETIQKAANEARAGDTVFIRGGTYREQVNLTQSGTETAPITFAAFNNENVTVTATDLLTGFVRSADPTDNNNIYTANLSGDASDSLLSRHELTVFVNGRVVQEAKSRNAADYLNVDTWETFNSANGRTVRDSTLVGSTDNYVGSFIRLRTSDFTLGESRVTGFDSSTGTLTLADSIGNPPSNGRYLLHDAVDLVDSAGEWHFNEETDTFTLWAPGGGDPDNQVVEVKRRAEAFDTNGRDYIHFENLTFTGGDLDARGSDGLVLDGIHVIASDRIFGPEFGTSRTALVFTGDNNVVRNSEFEQIWTAAIRSRGDNNHFVNNFFHDIAFSGGGTGGLVIEPTADANLVSHNTFTRSGRAAIIGTGTRGVIQHNDFSRIGRITVDVGAIYFFNRDAGGSVIRNNVFHDIGGKLNSGVYVDNYTTNLAIHHNVFHRVSPFGGKLNLPNSFILYYNNTIFNSGRVDAFGVDGERNSYGSKFFNNIYGSIDSDLRTGGDPIEFAGNFATTSGGNFVNAGAGDFRLRNSSGAVDAGIVIEGITDGFAGAAPDAGAYERGAALFEVGHDFNASPNPAYEFQTPAFSNLLSNSSFELGLSDWKTTIV